ncbi:hypothetical protein PRK78_006745 [Emydomyces testavorans]|uniref:Uncharacterized protein n=1 Tax=Emydomyces testavorans TaxID=2070801 RepID=A0AAF0IKT5_9EURO|nr:hypothetical protein PRK78_006745 [Emydomyces testavorans]
MDQGTTEGKRNCKEENGADFQCATVDEVKRYVIRPKGKDGQGRKDKQSLKVLCMQHQVTLKEEVVEFERWFEVQSEGDGSGEGVTMWRRGNE